MCYIEHRASTILFGAGDLETATKIGKRKGTVIQADGTATNVTLSNYKHVPKLWTNLFSLTASIASGWKVCNEGKILVLTKGKQKIKFDRIIKTGDGYLCGVEIPPQGTADTAMVSQLKEG